MTLLTLLAITVIALLGPVLSWVTRWRAPVLVGQILGGLLIGGAGLGWVDAGDSMFTLLADLGFALTMFVAGSQIPVRNPELRPLLLKGLIRAAAVAVAALALGALISLTLHSADWLIYTVVLGSSSAALALPAMAQARLTGPAVTATMAQIAVADVASIVLLPLVMDTGRALLTIVGALALCALTAGVVLALRMMRRRGMLSEAHRVSRREHLALELRISLVLLLAFAVLASQTAVSIMLAGFAAGVAVSAIGEPRRLAKQVFALSEGFFSPLFYVWLGASLSLGDLWSSPRHVLLGLALGFGGLAVHAVSALTGQPASLALLGGAQLGVPIAAATIGMQTGALNSGDAAALVFGALISVVSLSATVPLAARRFATQR
ncbi:MULTISPECIES: cation:proton antiporter [unclassified Pseudoclavibacter]|uniref:cation:proton antiporter domain-containing protein n=1 Tax=unclassified Pseudoclavibacter TaxID=2615177 RepID=UPI00130144CF|nr:MULTISPECIES: cation:proton antiporter [unclassified Pseudoclavibacter]KAB1646507.1 cation:proton antiporter [Pseudoclavibacter sp. CFCC 14310]KAB1663335.1 cation:proton antiporter [Pseudoclavibacter sp. CFCC 13611]